MLLGTVLAMVNMSACRVALPNRNASSISRKKPITRDSAVPPAITALAEISRADGPGPGGAASSAGDVGFRAGRRRPPRAGRARARLGATRAGRGRCPELVEGAGSPGASGIGSSTGSRPDWVVVSAIASVRRPEPTRRQRGGPRAASTGPSWASADSRSAARPPAGRRSKPTGAARCRPSPRPRPPGPAPWPRSGSAVRCCRSAPRPAPRAISQPVVPFWVTCTSSWMGSPTRRSVSVSSWAVTGTMPLARAVTSASTVTLSWARISGSSIGLMVSRRSLSEVKISRAWMALSSGSVPRGRVLRTVIGNTTPSWSMVLTLGRLRISTPLMTSASTAACCGPRKACRARSCCRQAPLAARATAAPPVASACRPSTSRSVKVRWVAVKRRRLLSWPAVSSPSRTAAG